MTVEQLRRMHQAKPFHPFDVHLTDRREIPVNHQEMLAITPPGKTIGIGLDDGTIEIVELLLVTSLRPHASGRSRSRKP